MSLCFCLSHYCPPHPHFFFFFFNDTATTEIYTLSLHDALPISPRPPGHPRRDPGERGLTGVQPLPAQGGRRSEEHTSELQSQSNLVCRLLLEKKKKKTQRSQLMTKCQCLHSNYLS